MTAEESLRRGELQECLEQLQNQIRGNPTDVRSRIFLFQLLALTGAWDRAMTSLNVLAELDASTLAMVHTYREALRCEVLRRDVFAGLRAPMVFGDPQQWVAQLVQTLKLITDGEYTAAQSLRDQAFESAPATSGEINGQPFAWIADQDTRLGPLIEAIVNGAYYWIPFDRIRRVQIEAPEDLRDFVWLPANFTWSNGGEAVGLIPTRYPGSENATDPQVRLARKTEWVASNEELAVGFGQRMLATDQGEYALMDVRDITLNSEEPADGEEPASAGSDDDG